jgi:hypothetical protein
VSRSPHGRFRQSHSTHYRSRVLTYVNTSTVTLAVAAPGLSRPRLQMVSCQALNEHECGQLQSVAPVRHGLGETLDQTRVMFASPGAAGRAQSRNSRSRPRRSSAALWTQVSTDNPMDRGGRAATVGALGRRRSRCREAPPAVVPLPRDYHLPPGPQGPPKPSSGPKGPPW